METPAVADVQPKKSKQSPAREDEGGADSGASTSGTAKSETRTKEEPVSEFYQSLLESSYTDDGSELQFKRKNYTNLCHHLNCSPFSGWAQLSEREMLQKALAESAMDFVKRCDRTKGSSSQDDKYGGTTDEEYDSPSP